MADLLEFVDYTVNLDIIRDYRPETKIVFMQNNKDSSKILFNFTKLGKPIDMSGVTSVLMAFKKPDRTLVWQGEAVPVDATQGKYIVTLRSQVLAVVGKVLCHGNFTLAGKTIETRQMFFEVEGSFMSDQTIESNNDFPVIEKAIEVGQQFEGVDVPKLISVDSRVSTIEDTVISVLAYGTPTDTLQTKLNLALAENNSVTIPSGSYTGDLVINQISNKTIHFNQVTITGNVRLSRLTQLQTKGKLKVTGDIDIIGANNCKFDSLECNMFYVQNWSGWGGIYWVNFDEVICKAMQVRQAKLYPNTSTSAINAVYIRKLIAQYGLASNNWYNVWLRDGASGGILEHTTIGTHSNYTGTDKWDVLYTNPFVVENFDFSYTNAPVGTDSFGIVHEGTRPIYLNNGFLENVTYASRGPIISEKLETRNTKVLPVSGVYDYYPAESIGKLGNFRTSPVSLVDNSEFNLGLKDYTSFGKVSLVTASSIGATVSHSGLALKLEQDTVYPTRLIYSFVSPYTGPISVAVRGKNIGNITVTDGASGTQYGLGYEKDTVNFGTSVGRATITKGQVVTVSVYTPAYTTLGTGEITYITGFQVFLGYSATNIKQAIDSSYAFNLPMSTAQNQWVDAFNITASPSTKVKMSFEVSGKVEGRGFYEGYYEGILAFDATGGYDSVGSSTVIKSYNYKTGEPNSGVASIDTQFISKAGGGITLQFAKQFFGTQLSASFVNVKVSYPAKIN